MAQVATPKQLPMQLRPQNHPYNAHTNCLSKELIRNHRQNMVPLATALKQKAAACKTSVSNHGRIRRGQQQRRQTLTTTLQLAKLASIKACGGL